MSVRRAGRVSSLSLLFISAIAMLAVLGLVLSQLGGAGRNAPEPSTRSGDPKPC